MKKIYLLLVFVILSSCQKKELSYEFRDVILKYQKKIPLPMNAEKYVYVVHFFRFENDTLFNLIRCSGISNHDSVSGVYQDKTLKPLIIIDRDKLGKKIFYLKKLNKNISDYYRLQLKEDFPPLYRYKIKNNKIILINIDTISDHWKK